MEIIRLRPINVLDDDQFVLFKRTNEFRPPKHGEWYTEYTVRKISDTAIKAIGNHKPSDWLNYDDAFPEIVEPFVDSTYSPIDIKCPKCNVSSGVKCLNKSERNVVLWKELDEPHEERVEKLKQLIANSSKEKSVPLIEKKLIKVTCNRCKKETNIEYSLLAWAGARFKGTFGFGSIRHDMETWEFDLCEDCADWLNSQLTIEKK